MHDRDLYAKILGIGFPWTVADVEILEAKQEVIVRLAIAAEEALECPKCRKTSPRYDSRPRRWRHLDTCQFRTILVADVPRVNCPEDGVHQIFVPWAEPGSHFTALLECLTIDWLKEANLSAVARRLDLSWDEIAGIMERAVQRGLSRRKLEPVRAISVDETSFQKRHQYVTVVTDMLQNKVIHVEDGRETASLDRYYETLSPEELSRIEIIAMDMCQPYIQSTLAHVPDAEEKIAFDKFHVAKLLGDAVDKVRRIEHRELRAAGDEALTGTRYLWLQNPQSFTDKARTAFESLKDSGLRVARAWAIKETAMSLWNYAYRGAAEKAWRRLLGWAFRSRLEPVVKAARTIRNHLGGILNAIVLSATSAVSESTNAIIQWIKRKSCGFRNRKRFKDAIYFHLGGLDLYPRPSPTHTNV